MGVGVQAGGGVVWFCGGFGGGGEAFGVDEIEGAVVFIGGGRGGGGGGDAYGDGGEVSRTGLLAVAGMGYPVVGGEDGISFEEKGRIGNEVLEWVMVVSPGEPELMLSVPVGLPFP